MTDNKTASAKSDATKTENLPETTTKETLPPSPLHTGLRAPGVHAMGSTGRRMLSSITDRIPGSTTNVSNGVQVEKGERQCAIDLSVVIEYGYSVVEVANKLRETIIDAVEYGTGLEVVEVNVQVTDVYIQGEDDHDDDQSDQVAGQRKNTELS